MIKKISTNKEGIALLLAVVLLALLLLLGMSLLSFSLVEGKISSNQVLGVKSYYLAEAGVNEMLWKLTNEDYFKSSFENNPNWTATITRTDPFGIGSGSYEVTITNKGVADGVISSVGRIVSGGASANQSVVRVNARKVIEDGDFIGLTNGCSYSSDNFHIINSQVEFSGDLYSNGNFNLSGSKSKVLIDGDIYVAKNKSISSSIDYTLTGEVINPSEAVSIPVIDFDSSDPNSFKNRADIIYTEEEFENLLNLYDDLVLDDPITYVTGNILIPNGKKLTINGVLVLDGSFELAVCPKNDCEPSQQISVSINRSDDRATGLLTKENLILKHNYVNIIIAGVLYSQKDLVFQDMKAGSVLTVSGAIIGDRIFFDNINETVKIIRDEEALGVLKSAKFSPLQIDEWHEVLD